LKETQLSVFQDASLDISQEMRQTSGNAFLALKTASAVTTKLIVQNALKAMLSK
jgi:hypothetical protein